MKSNQFNTNFLQKAPKQHERQLGTGTDWVINSITETCMFSLPLLWEAAPSLSSTSETSHHADSLHAVWSNVCHAGGVSVSHTPTQVPVTTHVMFVLVFRSEHLIVSGRNGGWLLVTLLPDEGSGCWSGVSTHSAVASLWALSLALACCLWCWLSASCWHSDTGCWQWLRSSSWCLYTDERTKKVSVLIKTRPHLISRSVSDPAINQEPS